MEHTNESRVIYFSDLFFVVLYAWKKILIAALALAVLLGGIQTARVLTAHDVAPTELTDEDLEKIAELEEKIASTQVRLEGIQYYMENSEFMKMNPYQVYQATANIYVDAETPEITTSLTWAYQTFLRSYVYGSNIANTLGCIPDYVGELVAIQAVEDTDGLLTVTVSYGDLDGAVEFLEVLLEGTRSETARISQDIAPHTIRIISYSPTQKHNSSMLTKQKDYASTRNTLESDLEAAQEKLDAFYETSAAAELANPVIFAVIGAVAGAAVIACFVLIRYFVTDKVYSARTLQSRSGIKVLGCLPTSKKCNKLTASLRKLENRVSRPEQIQVTLAAAAYHCRDAKNVLICGNYDSAELIVIQETLTANGLNVIDGQHVLYHVAGVNALSDCDAVLLLETCDKSRYTDISKTAEMIKDYNKPLIGCILLGG